MSEILTSLKDLNLNLNMEPVEELKYMYCPDYLSYNSWKSEKKMCQVLKMTS